MERVVASFRRSIPQMLGVLALSALFTFGCAAMALGVIDESDVLIRSIGFVGAALFCPCTLAATVRIFRAGPAIEVTTAGIRYRQRSADLIPWTAISEISVGAMGVQRFLVLHLWPEEAAKLKTSRFVRVMEKANEAFGFGGVWISMLGLNGSLNDLAGAVATANIERDGSLRTHSAPGGMTLGTGPQHG